MQEALKAYGKVSQQVASQHELEASLLLKAASQLQTVRDDWQRKGDGLDAALLYNRKLWTIFLSSVTSSENPLPRNIRQNVANLGIYVMKQTLSATTERRPEQLNSLIRINRELAAGLMAHA